MDDERMQGKPLCRFPRGSQGKVADLAPCRGARGKLLAMGLTPGTVLEVVQSGDGPCRLRVRGSDVVIGHGLAGKIIACPANCPQTCTEPEPQGGDG